jgi:urease accessory protein
MTPALLILTDGRFPAGSHAHSSGMEAAVAASRVRTLSDVEAFLRGRLHTNGPIMAAFTAAAHLAVAQLQGDGLSVLDAELDARMAGQALRLASRKQGKALLRAGRNTWPSPLFALLGSDPHHALALGVTAAAAGLSTYDSAIAAVYSVVTGPASAAVRLLGLDPYQVQRLLARLASKLDSLATAAVEDACRAPEDLPDWAAPLSDIAAEQHATWEVRLFAS